MLIGCSSDKIVSRRGAPQERRARPAVDDDNDDYADDEIAVNTRSGYRNITGQGSKPLVKTKTMEELLEVVTFHLPRDVQTVKMCKSNPLVK